MQIPVWMFNMTAGRFLPKDAMDAETGAGQEDEDSDVPQNTPSTDSAGEDFEMLDKSTDSLSKVKTTGAQQGGRPNKRKGRKR